MEYKDTFGRMTRRTDMGGNTATTSFDQAGRVTRITGLEEQTFVWFNTGQLASQTSDMGSGYVRSSATFAYDAGGNMIAETFARDGLLYRNTAAAFDLQGRMTSWAEIGTDNVPAAWMDWSYDANGNIRRTVSARSKLNEQGVASSWPVEDRWFRYDNMKRVTLDGGSMSGGTLSRGTGTEITYRVDGSRATATSDMLLVGYILVWVEYPTLSLTASDRPSRPIDSGEGRYVEQPEEYFGSRRETYTWRDDGQLQSVTVMDTGYVVTDANTLTSTGDFTRYDGSATYDYDALGRQTRQVDRNEAGSAVYDRQVAYDTGGRGLIASETVVTIQQGGNTVTTSTTNDYGVGADYALGAVRQSTVGSTVRSGGTTTTTSTTTTNSYQWRDGAVLLRSVTSKAGVADSTSNYGYSGVGQLETVSIGGTRPRTVTFVTDLAGQVVRRDEADATYGTGDPHEIWYRHGGREIGHITNNGSAADTYGESIVRRGLAPGDGPFMTERNPPRGSAFAETIDRINSYETGGSARGYTVQGGETLAGIAAQLWGDSSLWYKLASANGLTADSALTTGQVLAVPAGVVRSTYNADSYRPYDPADMLGDLSPVTPTPAAKGNKCGAFGKILLVVVAVAVTIVSSGAALAALSSTVTSVAHGITTVMSLGGAATVGTSTLIAAGVAGAMVGSAASQGVGIATGMRDRFDWTGVAMAGLAAGVSGGLAAAGIGSGVAGAALRGALGNTITQGVAMATGLQKRFDWVGLAVAGVTAAVGQAVAGDSPSFWRQTAAGAVSGIAGAATRSVLTGTSFGDNILAVLPDVIGSTVGRLAARGIAGGGRLSTSGGKATTLSASGTEFDSGAQDAAANPVGTTRNIDVGTANNELSLAQEAVPIYGPAEPGISYAVQNGDELIVTGDLSKRTIAIDYSLISWLAPSPSMLFPSGSITPYSNPLGQYFTQLPNAWQGFHYAGRDYRSAAEAQAFGMPAPVDAFSARREYEARRDAAFLRSIGSGGLGLGPIAYVMGGSPGRIDASSNLDGALAGLAQGAALRPVGRIQQPSSRAGLEPLSGRSVGTGQSIGASSPASVGDGLVYLRTDSTGKLAPYIGQTTEANELARQGAHARAYPNSRFEFETIESGIPRGIALDIAEHNAIQTLTGGVAARRSSAVSNQRDPVGVQRRQIFGLPEPK